MFLTSSILKASACGCWLSLVDNEMALVELLRIMEYPALTINLGLVLELLRLLILILYFFGFFFGLHLSWFLD